MDDAGPDPREAADTAALLTYQTAVLAAESAFPVNPAVPADPRRSFAMAAHWRDSALGARGNLVLSTLYRAAEASWTAAAAADIEALRWRRSPGLAPAYLGDRIQRLGNADPGVLAAAAEHWEQTDSFELRTSAQAAVASALQTCHSRGTVAADQAVDLIEVVADALMSELRASITLGIGEPPIAPLRPEVTNALLPLLRRVAVTTAVDGTARRFGEVAPAQDAANNIALLVREPCAPSAAEMAFDLARRAAALDRPVSRPVSASSNSRRSDR